MVTHANNEKQHRNPLRPSDEALETDVNLGRVSCRECLVDMGVTPRPIDPTAFDYARNNFSRMA